MCRTIGKLNRRVDEEDRLIRLYDGEDEKDEFLESNDISYIPIIRNFGTWKSFKSVCQNEKDQNNSLNPEESDESSDRDSLMDY